MSQRDAHTCYSHSHNSHCLVAADVWLQRVIDLQQRSECTYFAVSEKTTIEIFVVHKSGARGSSIADDVRFMLFIFSEFVLFLFLLFCHSVQLSSK